MNPWKGLGVVLLVLVIGALIGGFVTWKTLAPVSHTEYITIIDTVTVDRVIRSVRRDTVYIPDHEAIDSLVVAVGSKDSALTYLAAPFGVKDTTERYIVAIDVSPIEKALTYDIQFEPVIVERVVEKRVEVIVDAPWYERPLYFISGIGAGALIVLLTQ